MRILAAGLTMTAALAVGLTVGAVAPAAVPPQPPGGDAGDGEEAHERRAQHDEVQHVDLAGIAPAEASTAVDKGVLKLADGTPASVTLALGGTSLEQAFIQATTAPEKTPA